MRIGSKIKPLLGSLAFRVPLLFVIMLLLMIGAFLWVMETEGRPAIESSERQRIRQTGEATVAELSNYLEKSASLALSMANIAESLPLSKSTFSKVFRHALDEPSIKGFVAGGGDLARTLCI